ncbi:MAG: DsbA family protein, partial [Nanoarchaeota archaeon]
KPSANEKRKKRPSKKSRVPKWLWILLLLLAVLAFITFTSPGEEEEPDPLARNVTGINETIQIEYYKSYACDYCMNTHETLEKLKDIYNHTVNISYIHYPYNIELDFEMDMAFECAKPHNAKGYSIKLYNATKPLEKEDMIELFNGNQTEFAECLNGNQTAEKVLKDYQRSLEDGIESVPTIKIDGSMLKGNRGIGVYMAIIDNELGIEP